MPAGGSTVFVVDDSFSGSVSEELSSASAGFLSGPLATRLKTRNQMSY